MKKDLRFFQTVILLSLLPLIPLLRTKYIIYPIWALSLGIVVIHLGYYIMRSIKAGMAFNAESTPENRLSFQHFLYKFVIMFFAYTIAGWMIYVGFRYSGAV